MVLQAVARKRSEKTLAGIDKSAGAVGRLKVGGAVSGMARGPDHG